MKRENSLLKSESEQRAREVCHLEEELKKRGKNYEFHRYDGAGHGIWYYDKPMYRQVQAMESWNVALKFFDDNLK